jgi:D-3-phosphoglycerate dehydrogenase
MNNNIVITDCDHGFYDPEEKIIKEAGYKLDICQCREPEKVIQIARNAVAIICQYAEINRDVLRSLPKCLVVARYGVGLDNIDVKAATEMRIKVVHTPYFCFEDVANHTMGLILALSRQIVRINNVMKSNPGKNYGELLNYLDNVERPTKQTLGIIGIGKIGSEVAKRAITFGYKVIAYDPCVPQEIMSAKRVDKVGLSELFRESDIVTIHAPLTDETRKMVGAQAFALMKRTAYLINTARGPIVDEEALIEALRTHQVAGAALDVIEEEPIPANHPFLEMDNVILTPHIGFYSRTSIWDLKTKVAQYTVNALKDEGEFFVANPQVLEKQ